MSKPLKFLSASLLMSILIGCSSNGSVEVAKIVIENKKEEVIAKIETPNMEMIKKELTQVEENKINDIDKIKKQISELKKKETKKAKHLKKDMMKSKLKDKKNKIKKEVYEELNLP